MGAPFSEALHIVLVFFEALTSGCKVEIRNGIVDWIPY
jgi:hypothetical protein